MMMVAATGGLTTLTAVTVMVYVPQSAQANVAVSVSPAVWVMGGCPVAC